MNNKCEHIILSKVEIERMLEFVNKHNDNIVLYFDTNEIGTEYEIQTQSDLINRKDNFEFITNWENW